MAPAHTKPPLHDPGLRERRGRLRTRANPIASSDCALRLSARLSVAGLEAPLDMILLYVPGGQVLDEPSLQDYASLLGVPDGGGLEDVAAKVAVDFSDVLLPRYIRLHLEVKTPRGHRLEAVLEDRQPGWTGQLPAF